MVVIVEFLWFFSYLLTGIAMDMGWYSLLHAHKFSWDVYEVKAFGDMWYVFTAIALLLYCAIRVCRSTFIARTLFSSDEEKYEQVEDALCGNNARVSAVRELIHELARKRGLPCAPLFLIEKSPQVGVSSCKIRFGVPPVMILTSAAINGLTMVELRWLVAMEMSRLYRGTSSLSHRDRAMMVKKVLYFMFFGVFKMIWRSITGVESSTGSSGILKSGQGLLSIIFLIVILFVVVGNGALALVGVGCINAILCTWLCRKWPDRRYAHRQLKKHGIAKAERKESIKNVKKRLRNKTPFASEEIKGARWEEISELFNTDSFRRKDHKQTCKENKIGFAFRYRWRHSWRFMAGLCVSFFIFSYPLFNLYKVTFPWSMVKEHKYEHDIMSWNPRYKIDFTYKGKPGNIAMHFENEHKAMVRVSMGGAAPYTGFAMLHTEISQGTVHKPAENRFLSCQLHKVMFTRLDKDSRLGSKEMDKIEEAVTRVLGNKLNGNVYPMGKREGVAIFSWSLPWPLYYLPVVFVTPCDFEDLFIWVENWFAPQKRL